MMFETVELTTILRVVPSLQAKFEEHLRNGDKVTIKVEPRKGKSPERLCILKMGLAQYRGILMDLPRHVEAYKTLDSQQYFKTNDIGQILLVVEEETDLNQYANSEYFPDGLTPPMKNAVTTLRVSQKSLRAIPKEDLSAIESIIYNDKTSEFTFQEVIEEEPPTLPSSPKNKDKNRIVSV